MFSAHLVLMHTCLHRIIFSENPSPPEAARATAPGTVRRTLDSLFRDIVDPTLWAEGPLYWQAAHSAVACPGTVSDPSEPASPATSSVTSDTSEESFDLDSS